MSEYFDESSTPAVLDAQDTLDESEYQGEPRFVVKSQIGSGGLANVFLVQDRQRNGRTLAAKISHHPESEETAFKFFQRETQMLNKVHDPEEHPNVVVLYDSMICSNFPVLFMEYLPKALTSYITRVQKGRIEPAEEQVLMFLEKTGNGVKAIHAQDWTHRDIKPSNVLLSGDEERVKVADLGSIGRRGTNSSAMSVLIWRAPEVFPDTEKEEHYWTFKSDIYSLSVLGTALLSGSSKPFADDQNTAYKQKNDSNYLNNLVKNLPVSEQVRTALRRNLEPNPAKRCGSIDEFVALLKSQGGVELNSRKFSKSKVPAALDELVAVSKPVQPAEEAIVVDRKREACRRRDEFSAQIKANPDDAHAYIMRALAKTGLGDIEGAMEDYDKSIELRPDHASNYRRRAFLKERSGDLVGAMEDFDKSIELRPDHASDYWFRAHFKERSGDLVGAMEDFDKSIELRPDHADNYGFRAELKERSGDLVGAMEDFDKVIELRPDHASDYWFRAHFKERSGDLVGAMEDFDKSIELAPDDVINYWCRARLKETLGDLSGANKDRDKARELKPDDASTYGWRARLKEKLAGFIRRK